MEQKTSRTKDNNACGLCPQVDKCRKVWAEPNRGSLSPAGLVLGSAIGFLLPIMTAIITGAFAHVCLSSTGKTSLWEPIIAGAGLVTGASLAWLIMPIVKKRFSI